MRTDRERHLRKFLGLLALTRTLARSKRRLHFDPLGRQRPKRPPTPPPMAQPVPNPRVKAAKFQGKSKEDVDCHVPQFETKCQASNMRLCIMIKQSWSNLRQTWKVKL